MQIFSGVQETKLQAGQINLDLEGYYQFWNDAIKKGYSGTAVFTKKKPLAVRYGVGQANEEPEGRIITLEFKHFIWSMYIHRMHKETWQDYHIA